MSVSGTPALTLVEYLERLQGTTFRKLYQQPSTAFAIFRRMLTHLGELNLPILWRGWEVGKENMEWLML